MEAIIKPGKPEGTVQAPPSKSYAHRMLICAALSEGRSALKGISDSEDMLATEDCIRALGAGCEVQEGSAEITGIKEENLNTSDLPVFPCRESGSTLRFFIPLALALYGGGVFTGAPRLIERGIGVYEDLFAERNIQVEKTEQEIRVEGSLPAGTWQLRGDVSSQFVTGLFFALSLSGEDSRVEVLPPVESRAYIDITIDVMRRFGVMVREEKENTFLIEGGQRYRSGSYEVEGDWSNAAFLLAFQAVGSKIQVSGVNMGSMQGDKACVRFLDCLKKENPLPVDLSNTPDLGPVLFAAAAALHGGTFTGTRRLRIKESDRAEAMAEELRKFGITCRVGENDVTVETGELKKPVVPLNGHNDHRIVMALSVLCALTGGEIEGCEAVRKSWPDYFTILKGKGLLAEVTDSKDQPA